MKNKRLTLFFCITLLTLSTFSCFPQPTRSANYEKDKKIPMDKELYDEFRRIYEKCSTNCTNTGKIRLNINGADENAKYTIYSKDMENKRIDIESYDKKITILVRPDEILRYMVKPGENLRNSEKQNIIIYSTKTKKNVARFNHKKKLEAICENGNITCKVNGDETEYSLTDYTNNSNGKFTVDNVRGLLKHSFQQDNDGNNVIEATYQNFEFKKLDPGLFIEPSGVTFRSMDNSDLFSEPSSLIFKTMDNR